jgi:hypothetical protein
MGEEGRRSASDPEEDLSRSRNYGVQRRFARVFRTPGQRGLPDPKGVRPSPETSAKGRRLEGTPAGAEKVSS